MPFAKQSNPWDNSGISFSVDAIKRKFSTPAANKQENKTYNPNAYKKSTPNVIDYLEESQSVNRPYEETAKLNEEWTPAGAPEDADTLPSDMEDTGAPSLEDNQKKYNYQNQIKRAYPVTTGNGNSINIGNSIFTPRVARQGAMDAFKVISQLDDSELPYGMSKNGAAMLISNEMSRRDVTPSVPNKNGVVLGVSGLTVMGGFDLGQHSMEEFDNYIAPYFSDEQANRMRQFVGVKGQKALNMLRKNPMNDIRIPYETAVTATINGPLKYFANQMNQTFPGLDGLPQGTRDSLYSAMWQLGSGFGGYRNQLKSAIASQDVGRIKNIFKNVMNESRYANYRNRRMIELEFMDSNS